MSDQVPVLSVQAVSKHFGGVAALTDVSLDVSPGERVAVIGPNGAGKSTLFNVCNGQVAASRGKVLLNGVEIDREPIYRRASLGIARSFQTTKVFGTLTVRENAALAALGRSTWRYRPLKKAVAIPEIAKRTWELLADWQLDAVSNRSASDLSYGEQRRLEIVLSLASSPRLLLLDEPSAGLSLDESAGIVRQLRMLSSNVAIVFVAHDMDLVYGLSDRIVVLHQGSIIADGSPAAIQKNRRVNEVYMGA